MFKRVKETNQSSQIKSLEDQEKQLEQINRIPSLVKKNPFTTPSQVKNTSEEVGVSFLRSTINKCLQVCRNRGLTPRCKPLVTDKT